MRNLFILLFSACCLMSCSSDDDNPNKGCYECEAKVSTINDARFCLQRQGVLETTIGSMTSTTAFLGSFEAFIENQTLYDCTLIE